METHSSETAYSFTRLALPLMGRYNIPTTPSNYSVWYNYVAGNNQELINTIDTLLERGIIFTEQTNMDLYAQYCSTRDESRLRRIQSELQTLLVSLVQEIMGMSGNNEKYERILNRSVDILSQGTLSGDALGELIQDIIRETKAVVNYGKSLQERLRKTTHDLRNMQKEYDAAKQEAVTDYLTGIINRKAFMEKASELQAQAVKESAALSILFIDIDHFKQFNDTHGHLTGDEVLKFVAWTLKNLTRGKDVPARLGGEEFAVLLPETGLDGAMIVAEKIRSYFDTSGLKSRNDTRELGRISLSIGIALNRPDDTIDTLVDRADKAMYLAKKNGRNRVVSECEL